MDTITLGTVELLQDRHLLSAQGLVISGAECHLQLALVVYPHQHHIGPGRVQGETNGQLRKCITPFPGYAFQSVDCRYDY